MVLMVDANVVLDVFLRREPFFLDSLKVLAVCGDGKAQGILAPHSVTNIWYILRKEYSQERRRELLLALLVYFDVVPLDKERLVHGLYRNDFLDFEDCLQEVCACSVRADYIVTRDKGDYTASRTKVLSPEELVKLLRLQAERDKAPELHGRWALGLSFNWLQWNGFECLQISGLRSSRQSNVLAVEDAVKVNLSQQCVGCVPGLLEGVAVCGCGKNTATAGYQFL